MGNCYIILYYLKYCQILRKVLELFLNLIYKLD
jgi:hypothetical protein